jgi:hypothetical protein
MDIQQAWSKDMQHGQGAGTSSMDIGHGHEAWVMRHGHAAWTWRMGMLHEHAAFSLQIHYFFVSGSGILTFC